MMVPTLPLIGFAGYLLYGQYLKEKSAGLLASLWIILSFFLTLILFFQLNESSPAINVHLFDWINTDDLNIPFEFRIDQLSIIMMLLITGVGSLIHIYSTGYMHGDEGFSRFFAYLNLFIFFMLILVMANNFVLMFAGWEGVGLCSYLLIGFWYKDHENNKAANKAFIINRIGDLFLLFGLFLLYKQFGTFIFSDLEQNIAGSMSSPEILTFITLLLFIGATGKSAQIPLYTWLPDAMAGPTPVSALIHAATMVTAGIYLIVRSNFLFALAPLTNEIITFVGLTTSIFAGVIATKQNDIKKILAYSTISQLGLMFFALGLGAYGAAFFHLLTHAFFKALLFLGAGSVIHGLHGEQDIRNMGNLKKHMHYTHLLFLIGVLAIIALPPFSGFYSKDNILSLAYIQSPIWWIAALFAGLLTVFYMLRLYFVVFWGKERMSQDTINKIHESPWSMLLPLLILGILSVFGGWINAPELLLGNKWLEHFISPIVSIHPSHLPHSTEWILMAVSMGSILLVAVMTYQKYVSKAHVPLIESNAKDGSFVNLIRNKFYVDELYESVIGKSFLKLSQFFNSIFENQVVRRITDGTGQLSLYVSENIRKTQNGFISYYLFAMALGVLGILTIFIFFAL